MRMDGDSFVCFCMFRPDLLMNVGVALNPRAATLLSEVNWRTITLS